MDITDLSKVASRKRINTDAEKLREKVSRETAKIIKLKVAQDTAYWDLKERLQQLEGAHERLQQNMVDVQMQHEAASARYAAELRLRPGALNALAGARGVAGVLHECGARLRRGVARAGRDAAALGAAYRAAAAAVRRLAARRQRARLAARLHQDAARRAAELQRADARRLDDALQALGGARADAEHAAAARDRLAARLAQADEAAAAMRDDLARLLREFEAQSNEMKQTIARQQNEMQENASAAAAVRASLDAAQAQAGAARGEAARLRTELQRATCERDAHLHELQRARDQLAESSNTIDFYKKEDSTHVDEIKNLQKIINDKNQLEKEMESEIKSLKQSLCKLETEKLEANELLNKSEQQSSARADELRALAAAAAALRDERAALRAQRDADAHAIHDLSSAAAAKDRELDANSGTIARLMTELKAEHDARARADAALGAARALAQAKEDELSAQMTIILDMRGEKERLQERIAGMQGTIDNIQKELTGRPPPGARGVAAEQDATLYSFLSDGSADGDALDPREVGRRFRALARGERRLRTPQGSISLSQVKDDLKIKSRTFFKNKRFECKSKKLK